MKALKPFTILVKDVEAFLDTDRVMYASGDGKRFFITLKDAPKFVVRNMATKEEHEFTNLDEAVKFFNELETAPQEQPTQDQKTCIGCGKAMHEHEIPLCKGCATNFE